MSLSTTIEQIKQSLARAERTYAEGRVRQAALAPYDSVSAVLAAVDRGSTIHPEQCDAILFALIEEMRRSPSALWQSLLLVAFAPLVLRQRQRLRRPWCVDLDQRVLSAFLEAARAVRSPAYVPRQLLLGVRWRLHAERNRDRRSRDLVLFDDDTYAPDRLGVGSDTTAAAGEVLAMIEAEGGSDLRAAMLEKYGAGGSVKEYVDHAYPHLAARERERLCDRLSRQEAKALRKLRARVRRRERHALRVA